MLVPDKKGQLPRKEDLLEFPVEKLLDNSITDFDLYLEVGGTLVLYASSPYRWLREELQRLLVDGHSRLFYSSADSTKVVAYQAISTIPKIDENLPPARRVVAITDAAAELTRILHHYPLTEASLAKGQEISAALVRCVEFDPTCIAALGKLASHDQYTYYHSARVAAYALAIAMQLSARDDTMLQELALGCLLHDIGKSKIDIAIINKTGPLNDAEWTEMRKHPQHGFDLIAPAIISAVPREVILHHHERLDGSGYPHGLHHDELLEEVKIAAFADVFDALTSDRPYHVGRTRYEALEYMKQRLLDKVSRDAFQAMVELFGSDAKIKSA